MILLSIIDAERIQKKNYFGNMPLLFKSIIDNLKKNIKVNSKKINFSFSFHISIQGKSKIQIDMFNESIKKTNFITKNIIPHGDFRLNIASERKIIRDWSFEKLYSNLKQCAQLGIPYFNIHFGSNKDQIGYKYGVNNIIKIFKTAKKDNIKVSGICLENSVKHGNKLLTNINDYKIISKLIPKSLFKENKISFCIDTCHLFNSGVNCNKINHLESFFNEFDKIIGLKYLKLLHLNGSLFPFNMGLDRHSNFQNSYIQSRDFYKFMSNFITKHKLNCVLEFPQKKNTEWKSSLSFLINNLLN